MTRIIGIVILLLLFFACNQPENKQTERFNDYLDKAFNETIDEQDSLLIIISGRGCFNCSKAALKYYVENIKDHKKVTFLVTKKVKDALKRQMNINFERVRFKCDTSNLLKRVDLPFEGIAKMKIRDNTIDTIRPLGVDELTEKEIQKFYEVAN